MSEVHLISRTGISPGNYKYWESKTACDDWFLSKQIGETISNVSFIRADQITKNAYNTACVHIPLPRSACALCDYISFKNEDDSRLYHAQVVGIEHVNAQSTRLYFAVDFVATFWDTIKLNKSYIQRTHVSDDWANGFTASKYLLPEPIPTLTFYRPEVYNTSPVESINQYLVPEQLEYNLVTSVDATGKINQPKINFQCGGSIAGNLTTSRNKGDIEKTLSNVVSYTPKLINRGDSISQYANNIYLCPYPLISDDDNPSGEVIEATFKSHFNLGSMYKPKHAKVYDTFRLRIYSNGSGATYAPADVRGGMVFDIMGTGGPSGTYSVAISSGSVGAGYSEPLNYIETQSWPSVNFSATIHAQEFSLNETVHDKLTSLTDSVKGRIQAYKEHHAEYLRTHP